MKKTTLEIAVDKMIDQFLFDLDEQMKPFIVMETKKKKPVRTPFMDNVWAYMAWCKEEERKAEERANGFKFF